MLAGVWLFKPSRGRSLLNTWRKRSNRLCCARSDAAGGFIASSFSVRCIPLMATVLLRAAWLNALVHDPELHPAEREL
jgi:hypothetical protein